MVTVWTLGDGDNHDGGEGSDDSDDGKNRGNGGTIGIPSWNLGIRMHKLGITPLLIVEVQNAHRISAPSSSPTLSQTPSPSTYAPALAKPGTIDPALRTKAT